MSRTLRVLVMIVLLASCGGGNYSAPRNLDNACSILAQRPKYARAFRATERRWGYLALGACDSLLLLEANVQPRPNNGCNASLSPV